MFITKPLAFVAQYIDAVNQALQQFDSSKRLTRIQKSWLAFCIMGIFMTRTVCWAKFERASLGKYSLAAISWMFRKSKIPWNWLLTASTMAIIRRYGITHGVLVFDETDKKRSKSVKRIFKAHKIKDKASGGFVMGQSLVFLILVTPQITVPVGFQFYMPDPELKKWNKLDKKLRKQGVPKKDRPAKPARDKNYPKVTEIALALLRQFQINFPNIKVDCILADALYGTHEFLDGASQIFKGVQVISQIKKNQNVIFRNKSMSVEEYFAGHPGFEQRIQIRGGKVEIVMVSSARLKVCAHGKKRFVIALKYEGEEEYRYIVATDMSWRTLDIVKAYTLRWLIEVFFEDFKVSEGWGRLTKHTGKDGSSRSLILSLMVDHCLFFHPDQQAFLDNKLTACTVGSLMRQIRIECFVQFLKDIISSENPQKYIDSLTQILKDEIYWLTPSSKHMSGRTWLRLEPSPALKYKNAV